jgi:hypothetical protein
MSEMNSANPNSPRQYVLIDLDTGTRRRLYRLRKHVHSGTHSKDTRSGLGTADELSSPMFLLGPTGI